MRRRVELFKALKDILIEFHEKGGKFNLCFLTCQLEYHNIITREEESYLDLKIDKYSKSRKTAYDIYDKRVPSHMAWYVWRKDDFDSRLKWLNAQIKKYSYEK